MCTCIDINFLSKYTHNFVLQFLFQAALKTQLRTDKTDALALKLEVNTLKQTLAENEEELVSVKIECSSYCNLLEVKNAYGLTDC